MEHIGTQRARSSQAIREPDPGTTNPDDTDEPASGTGNEADDGKASDYQ